MIIDVHNHIGHSGDGCAPTIDELLAAMDASGIDTSVVFPIDDKQADVTYERLNDEVAQAQRDYPDRLIGFCRVNPMLGAMAMREMQRSAEIASDVLGAANELHWPVVIHVENEPECHPEAWCKVLRHYTQLRAVFTHGAKGAYRELPGLIRDLPQMFVDTSCMSLFRSQYLLEHLGPERMVFGSDFPYSHPAIELQKHVLMLPDAAVRQRVLYDNAVSFLRLEQ
jgi:uncharacterized protein